MEQLSLMDLLEALENDTKFEGDLEKILTQKWLALFNNGHEAWFNIRRMGIPSLQVAADNLNGDQYPVRYRYPQTEQAANNAHRLEAAGRIGGDTYNSPGWWEQ